MTKINNHQSNFIILYYCCRLENQRSSMRRAQLIIARVGTYAVFCLPFSLNTALSLLILNPEVDPTQDPVMVSLLHTLCILQFSANFLLYTVMPGTVRDMHCALLDRVKLLWLKLARCKRFRNHSSDTQISVSTTTSEVPNIDIDYEPEETYL